MIRPAGQAGGTQCSLAPGQIPRFARGFPCSLGLDGFPDDAFGFPRMFLAIGAQLFIDDGFDKALHLAVP